MYTKSFHQENFYRLRKIGYYSHNYYYCTRFKVMKIVNVNYFGIFALFGHASESCNLVKESYVMFYDQILPYLVTHQTIIFSLFSDQKKFKMQ